MKSNDSENLDGVHLSLCVYEQVGCVWMCVWGGVMVEPWTNESSQIYLSGIYSAKIKDENSEGKTSTRREKEVDPLESNEGKPLWAPCRRAGFLT